MFWARCWSTRWRLRQCVCGPCTRWRLPYFAGIRQESTAKRKWEKKRGTVSERLKWSSYSIDDATNYRNEPREQTSSSAVAKRPRDASSLSVVSFNSTKRRTESFIVSYIRLQLYHYVFCSVVFGVTLRLLVINVSSSSPAIKQILPLTTKR